MVFMYSFGVLGNFQVADTVAIRLMMYWEVSKTGSSDSCHRYSALFCDSLAGVM